MVAKLRVLLEALVRDRRDEEGGAAECVGDPALTIGAEVLHVLFCVYADPGGRVGIEPVCQLGRLGGLTQSRRAGC